MIVVEVFFKVYELAEKKWEIKDVIKGMVQVQGYFFNSGVMVFQDEQNYKKVYNDFKMVFDLYKVLIDEKEDSNLKNEEDYFNQLYIIGFFVINVNEMDVAKVYFDQFYEKKYDKLVIYELLYKIIVVDEFKMDEVYVYFEEGCKFFLDDVFLLFVEINYFFCIGKFDVLIIKL